MYGIGERADTRLPAARLEAALRSHDSEWRCSSRIPELACNSARFGIVFTRMATVPPVNAIPGTIRRGRQASMREKAPRATRARAGAETIFVSQGLVATLRASGRQSAAVAASRRVRTKSLFLLGSRCSATRSMISGKVVFGRKFASFSSFSKDGTRRSMSSKPGS